MTERRSKTRPHSGLRGRYLSLLATMALLTNQGNAALVTSCSAGQYLIVDMVVDPQLLNGVCATCPRGSKCPKDSSTGNKQLTSPLECDQGYYSAYGATACTICPQGWYCSAPAALPLPCATGSYSDTGATACTVCGNGSVCQADGSIRVCLKGETCVASNNYIQPIICPAGSRCSKGDDIATCDAGSYSLQGSGSCTLCPAGSYCPNTDHAPIECADGYYQDQPGQQVCLICPVGAFCDTAKKANAYEKCPLGSYNLLAGSTACTDCPAGMSCDANNVNWPAVCSSGYYSTSQMMNCLECPTGYSCEDQTSKTACTVAGTYSKSLDLFCITCPAGSYCPNFEDEIMCSAGYYSAPNAIICTECPAGSYCADASKVPAQCPDGQTSDAGATFCNGCPAGATCLASTNSGAPTFCTATEVPNQDGTACVDCPAGYACPGRQWAKMEQCSPGYYSTAGMNYCQIADAGYYAETTIVAPTQCETGWTSDVGQTYCTQCPPGFTCPDQSGRHNTLCKPGSTYDGDGTCGTCAGGNFCPIAIGGYRATAGEIACVAGTYSPAGSFDCELCKPGYDCATDTSRVTTGTPCNAGTVQFGGSATCSACGKNQECPFGQTQVRCPAFFYATNDASSSDCQPCPAGQDCEDFSMQGDDPVDCTSGYYSQALDFVCRPCPKGHACSGTGVTSPTKCAAGTYAYEGQGSCTTCPAEYYSAEGQEYCMPVPPGYKINTAVSAGIEVCAHKTYSRWGETTCSTCKDGFLCPQQSEIGSAWTMSCPRGSWCAAGVQTKCAAGKFGIQERSTSINDCADCPPGYNCQPGTSDFELHPCPKGGYCPMGTPVIACPSGTFNNELYGRSLSDCKTCPIGHQCGEESADGGTICAKGYYCPRGSGTGSYPCPAGTHGNAQTGKKDVNECSPCPPGHYCPEASETPTVSPIGYYSPLSGLPSLAALYKCPPKHHCPNTGMTTYKGYFCSAGYVCPAASTSSTMVDCPEGSFSDREDLHDPKHCDICPKGYACGTHYTTTEVLASECPRHRYCPDATKLSKIPLCPAGTYAPYTKSKSQYDCLVCPAGAYCDGGEGVVTTGVANGPQTCPVGYYCPPGTAYVDQHPCAPGYYNDQTGQVSANECLHCGFNKYCKGYANTIATQCPSGTYNDASTTASLCTPCPAGYECDQSSATFTYAIPCSKGFYSATGATACTYCPVGTYCPNEATTDINLKDQLCPKGTLCLVSGNSVTINSILTTVDTGLDVYPNKKSGTGGHACPLQKYCPKGTTQALDVPRGTMQELWARGSLVDAIQMPAGNYTLTTDAGGNALTQPYVTTECPTGYYCPFGSYEAIPCPTGYYRPNILGRDADSCSFCPAGTYCPTVGTTTPTDCPQGHFCPEGANAAQPCPRGTYFAGTKAYDSRGCTACSPGHYCPLKGQIAVDTTNNQCDAGFYCIGGSSRPEPTDQTTGRQCPRGRYCGQGASSATGCEAGNYTPYVGSVSVADCVACRPGYYCISDGLTDDPSIACAAGYYCSGGTVTYLQYDPATYSITANAGTTAYYDAGISPIGSYAVTGSTETVLCPEGKYNEQEGRSSCDNCEAGYFCDGLGTTQTGRQLCALGHYCESYASFLATAAATTPTALVEPHVNYQEKPCPAGTYNPLTTKTSLSDCLACPAGKACEEQGMHDVDTFPDCAAGYFCISGASTRFPETGSTTSGPCPVGHYCLAGNSSPVACLTGTWSNQLKATDASFCLDCPPGFLCEGTGNYTPSSNCAAGTYRSTSTDSTCSQCGASGTGVYCPLGSHFELYCPMGFYQPAVGRGNCSECPAGSFCMNGLAAQCDAGFYCP